MADTYDLDLVQGELFARSFVYKPGGVTQDLSAWTWKAQARQREAYDAELFLDLTAFITLDIDDETLLLVLPAATTFALPKAGRKAHWDLFIWPTADPTAKVMLIQGDVTLDLATTDLT